MLERLSKSKARVEKVPEKIEAVITQDEETLNERELQELLDEPANKFLTEIAANRQYIENAAPKDALNYALNKIEARLQRTFKVEQANALDRIISVEISYKGMSHAIEAVIQNAREIGRGGDAFVIVNKNEIRNLPPEICYKFAIAEATPRGRNETFDELRMQNEFYKAAEEYGGEIGVPMPFYAVEIGGKKVIAMEKLNAASIDDILRGKGSLPGWIDIDTLYNELREVIDFFHQKGLFHRDMHLGNIMVSQSPQSNSEEKMAYIIDFGLSSIASDEMQPYKKELAGAVFTYNNDYVILDEVRNQLNSLRRRKS
jgi:serine/threonine protein kinase